MSDMTYRKELDGLRAIAVLAVILFHVGYPDMKGGFVGVDIFFVLSGFLICGQTYLRLQEGTYSVTDFFARRIRRLAAAYGACFLVTALLADAFFLRSEMQVVADGFLGSITFTNNFNLLNSTGYFAGPAHENPFLHTWSLSIEEQFYIVLPVVILLLQRSARAFVWVLCGLFVMSLALALFSGDLIYTQEERYFSSSFRIWQLAAGGLTFLAIHHGLVPRRIPLMPLLGIALVLAPIPLLDSTYLYPGWSALIPVLGTVLLVIFASPNHSWTGRALSWKPLTYIGRVSYGAYLWHWPVIVGVTYYGFEITDEVRAYMTLAAIALGSMSYHLIETPIRRVPIATGKRWLYGAFAVQSVVMLALAAYLYQQPGKAAAGEDARLELLKGEIMNTHEGWEACWSQTTAETFCRMGADSDTPDFFVWGDSMVNSAFWAFDEYGKMRGQSGRMATEPACAPLMGVAPRQSCMDVNNAVLAYLETAPPMDVFVMGRWSFYAEGNGHLGDEPGKVPLIVEGQGQAPENFPAFEQGLEAMLTRLSERHNVIVINHFPEYRDSIPKSMLRSLRFGAAPQEVPLEEYNARNLRTVEALRAAAARHGARHILPHLVMCESGLCEYQKDGVPLYIDSVHLGPAGNDMLLSLIVEAMKNEP